MSGNNRGVNPNDPTPEEIWGTSDTMGLAEAIRLERVPRKHNDHGPATPSSHVYMLSYGQGKLKAEGEG